MACPPSKRLRGLNQDVPLADPAEVDPFGDDDDFTQDDLDEIDIIASQAIGLATTTPAYGSKEASRPGSERAHGSGFHPSARPPLDRGNNTGGFGGKRGHLEPRERETTGNRPQEPNAGREDSYVLLEAQHADLRRKLKEVEEEIVSKSGEIRLLRDSLRGAQQEKETQRQALALLEKQKQREQSDKEKELNRKVQSLQSELQFKEAEINQMKSKLLSADRSKPASPLPRNSPKVPNGLSHLHGGSGSGSVSGSSSPTGSGFITKETFAARLPSTNAALKTSGKKRKDGSVDKQEVAWPDPFRCDRPPHRQQPGAVLLGLLLQQPLSPSSLCLSHLLSVSPSDICLTAKPNSAADLKSAGAGRSRGEAPRATLSPIQSLALTGLNMLTQSQPAATQAQQEHGCPGAVFLLPLLDMHLSHLCQYLDARGEAAGSLAERRPAATGAQRPDEADASAVGLEDAGLAALKILYLLINHSDEVVQALLSPRSEGGTEDAVQAKVLGHANKKTIAIESLRSHDALLRTVLRLCRNGGSEGASEEIVIGAVKVASILIERTPDAHADRLTCVLQALRACVSTHRKPRVLAECTATLARACDHTALTRQLCSHQEPCVLLKLLQHVRKRPVKQAAAHAERILLELQVVRLLNRLTQTAERWQSSSCLCYVEVVQTSVIVLHRQWLELYDRPGPTGKSPDAVAAAAAAGSPRSPAWWREPPARLLRECVLLLHWLLQHHAGFSAGCRPLLHMYDQAVPALRRILNNIPELSESEELAFEEICRPECDDTDDMETESGS
ncbi:ATR-interacting protein isoform X2 [Festucalex cinctus]